MVLLLWAGEAWEGLRFVGLVGLLGRGLVLLGEGLREVGRLEECPRCAV